VIIFLNNMANIHQLTPHIVPSLHTKWRSYRAHGFCDVILYYVYRYACTFSACAFGALTLLVGRPVKTEWWGAGVVVCLGRGADLHMAQRMPWYRLTRVKVKVKFSHTRYRALGPELIPVYRQSARRCREVNHAIYLAVVCHCFLPGLRSPS